MNKVQTKWGINNVVVGNLSITTVKLKVTGDFPVRSLPEGVLYYRSGRYFIINHAVVSSQGKDVINKIVDLLAQHAQSKLNSKYSRMRDPIAYDQLIFEQEVLSEYDHYQNSMLGSEAEF